MSEQDQVQDGDVISGVPSVSTVTESVPPPYTVPPPQHFNNAVHPMKGSYSDPAVNYGQQNMYGQPYPQPYQEHHMHHSHIQHQQSMVVVSNQPAGMTMVDIQSDPVISTNMGLACFVFWCCNCALGGIAFIFACMSSNARDEHNWSAARKYSRCAYWFAVIGIIISVSIATIIMIIIMW